MSSWKHLFTDLCPIFAPNFHPSFCINRAPAAGGARILQNRPSKLRSIFEPVLLSMWLHFCSKKLPKSRLGSLLVRLRKLSGALGALQEGTRAFPESSWSVLGSSWERFETCKAAHAAPGNLWKGTRTGQEAPVPGFRGPRARVLQPQQSVYIWFAKLFTKMG